MYRKTQFTNKKNAFRNFPGGKYTKDLNRGDPEYLNPELLLPPRIPSMNAINELLDARFAQREKETIFLHRCQFYGSKSPVGGPGDGTYEYYIIVYRNESGGNFATYCSVAKDLNSDLAADPLVCHPFPGISTRLIKDNNFVALAARTDVTLDYSTPTNDLIADINFWFGLDGIATWLLPRVRPISEIMEALSDTGQDYMNRIRTKYTKEEDDTYEPEPLRETFPPIDEIRDPRQFYQVGLEKYLGLFPTKGVSDYIPNEWRFEPYLTEKLDQPDWFAVSQIAGSISMHEVPIIGQVFGNIIQNIAPAYAVVSRYWFGQTMRYPYINKPTQTDAQTQVSMLRRTLQGLETYVKGSSLGFSQLGIRDLRPDIVFRAYFDQTGDTVYESTLPAVVSGPRMRKGTPSPTPNQSPNEPFY